MRSFFIWLNLIDISNKKRNELKTDISLIMKEYAFCEYSWSIEKVKKYERDLLKKGIKIITPLDEEYKACFCNVFDAPFLLYCMGDTKLLKSKSVGIVGSRKVTSYSKKVTEDISRKLVSLNETLISGGAYGVDAIAHKTAIENGGKTICVLANGFYHMYPKEHISLYKKIVENGGLLITEYRPEIKARKYFFPERNRIIAMLSKYLIVTQASVKSGSLITATYAEQLNLDIYTVPQSIYDENAKGTNELTNLGAILLTSIDDLEIL